MNKTVKGITIEIGGNTVNLGKALKNVDKTSKELNNELLSINRQLKFNPSSAVLLTQKQEVLKESIAASKDKLKELEAVQQDIERAYKNGEIDNGQYRAYQREVEQTKNNLENYEKQLKETKNSQAEFDKKIEKARQTLEANKTSLKAGIKTVGKYGAAVVGALGAAAGAAIKYASEFETAFAKTSTLLDEKKIDFDKYKEEIIKASNETGVEAAKIATSTYDAISAGVDPRYAVKFVKQAEKLSKGGFTEVSNSVDILTTILNAYQMKVKATAHISDVLLQTQNKGKVVVGELAQYMGKVIPIASSYNVSLENVASGYAILTARGIKAAQATTYMKSLLDELSKVKYDKSGGPASLGAQLKELTGKTFADLMKSGKSLGDVLNILYKAAGKNNTAFGAMFSKSNARAAAFSLMSAGAKKFNSTLKEMKNSSGAADAAYNKMADTAAHKTEVLKTNIQNAAIRIGEGMLPTIEELLSYIEKNLPAIQKMADDLGDKIGEDLKWALKNGDQIIKDIKIIAKIGGGIYAAFKLKQFVSTIGETVAAIRVLKLATDAETASQIALNTAQKANVIGLVVAGIVALTGVVWALNDTYGDYIKTISNWTDEEEKVYKQSKEDVKALEEAKKARQDNIEEIKGEFSYYNKLRKELDNICDKNGKVKDGYEDRARFIANTLSDKLGLEIKLNGNIIQNYKDIRKQIKETIKAKREEAKLNAYKDDYEKAIKIAGAGTSSKAYKEYSDSASSANKKEKTYKEYLKTLKDDQRYNRIPAIRKDMVKDDETGYYITPSQKRQLDEYRKSWNKAKATVDNKWKIYVNARTVIKNYENASAAIIESNHRTATKALNALTDEIITAGKAKNTSAGELLLKQYRSTQSKYEELATAYANGEKGITKQMVKAARQRRDRAQSELNKYANNVGIKAYEVADYVGGKLAKTDTKENKKKAKTSGKNITDATAKGTKPTAEHKKTVEDNAKKLVNSASNKEVRDNAKSKSQRLGNSFVDGFLSVLTIGRSNVFYAAWNFVKNALSGAKKAQKSNSPSKETTDLANYFISPYLTIPQKQKYKAYASAYDFVRSSVEGAKKAQSSFDFSALNSKSSIDYNSQINHRLLPVVNNAVKDNTPEVSVSSPVISIKFGDVTVSDEKDIKTLSNVISEQIAADIVLAGKARGK